MGAAAGTGAPGAGRGRVSRGCPEPQRCQQLPGHPAVWGHSCREPAEGLHGAAAPVGPPGEDRGQPEPGWVSGSQLPLSGSLGAGRVSWREIKQVSKPAWQAVKILPGFSQFCRKCHTALSIQAEINKKCISFPVNIFEISEAFLVPNLKFTKENWHELKKKGDGSSKSFVSETYLGCFFPIQTIH